MAGGFDSGAFDTGAFDPNAFEFGGAVDLTAVSIESATEVSTPTLNRQFLEVVATSGGSKAGVRGVPGAISRHAASGSSGRHVA